MKEYYFKTKKGGLQFQTSYQKVYGYKPDLFQVKKGKIKKYVIVKPSGVKKIGGY